jgi:hypothetical protein
MKDLEPDRQAPRALVKLGEATQAALMLGLISGTNGECQISFESLIQKTRGIGRLLAPTDFVVSYSNLKYVAEGILAELGLTEQFNDRFIEVIPMMSLKATISRNRCKWVLDRRAGVR